MKTLLLGVAALLALSGAPALAADMPLKARPMVGPVVAYNWTGCYIGGNVGGKWARTSDVVNIPAATGLAGPTTASFLDLGSADSSTFLGGGQVGCNWQSGSVVFGIEGDAEGQRWRRTEVIAGRLPALFVPGDTFEIRSDWQASVRGRIGYAWDRTLLYATGGVRFTDVSAYTNWIPVGVFPGVITSQTKTLVGATVGAGVEHAFTDNFTVGSRAGTLGTVRKHLTQACCRRQLFGDSLQPPRRPAMSGSRPARYCCRLIGNSARVCWSQNTDFR